MMSRFKIGEAVVHPARGAGVVERLEERERQGGIEPYYRIRMLGQQGSRLMIPANTADEIGLRRAISRSALERLWCVLLGDPERLPDEHKERCQVVRDKLGTGDAFQVAETVRDLTARRRRKKLTSRGRQVYDKAIGFLAGEIAAVERIDVADAETEIKTRLRQSLAAI